MMCTDADYLLKAQMFDDEHQYTRLLSRFWGFWGFWDRNVAATAVLPYEQRLDSRNAVTNLVFNCNARHF